MKLTILFIAVCMAVVAIVAANDPAQNETVANKQMLDRQMFVFDMLRGMMYDLQKDDWIKMGGKLNMDRSMYMKYSDWMVRFEHSYKTGGLLPRGEFYSEMQRTQMIQGLGLFEFFYNAKDWNTLVQNVVWARIHLNEGMFVNALTMAVIHRPDMKGIVLPQIYEIFPQMFYASKYILAAEQFDWETFNRKIMLEKELKTIYEDEAAPEFMTGRFHMKEWKVWQWWKLMGLDDGWKMEDTSMLYEHEEALNAIDPLWTTIYKKLKMVWMPVDYTRDIAVINEDSRMSYFTEDVGWNAYWYYLNMDYSKSLAGAEFNLDKDRRGEWFIYNVHQILARYYMERLSLGTGEYRALSWHGTVNTGYDPQLVAYNGNGFTYRKNYWQVEADDNLDNLNRIMNIEKRISDAIDFGQFVMKNGTVVDLTLMPESLSHVGNLLQGNIDVMDRFFFSHWWMLASKIVSGVNYRDLTIAPNVMMNPETMLRDPLSYSLLKRMIEFFNRMKYQLAPYTKKELLLKGVKIEDVKVDKLMTKFVLHDSDVSTLRNGKPDDDLELLFRQLRLDNDGVNYTMSVMAEQPQKVVIRMFMGPAFDSNMQKLHMEENRENFIEMDEFAYDLVAGQNQIHRNSEKDFTWTSGNPYSFTEMYNNLLMAQEGKFPFKPEMFQSRSLFPRSLILPRGWAKGMPMIMFFMVSPHTAKHEQYSSYNPSYQSGIGSGVRHIDDMPFGYPLDRKIDDLYEFLVPNMFYKQVKVYHMEKLDKYYPMKYENYGEFDKDF